ncbi:hypothetical protein [Kribbella kalugense]|uniref:Uncharacterized protein n=1 Tax=Kribbella kalugense TaxID=2512221 RepID=A0A4R7ZJ10_9ACTN|nr:hypothetical protein [Kribbella kalugense]TDW17729.1 hypothetical protein EV650_4305 [Kribbella kalugense]
MRQMLVVVGVVGLICVAGCGADNGPAVTAPSPASSSLASVVPPASGGEYPRPTPSAPVLPAAPTALSIAAAGAKYLQLTRPYNVALERFEKAANGNMSLTTLQARAKAVAAANLAESKALASVTWPSRVSVQIRALAKADATARPHWLLVAAAGSKSEMSRQVDLATTAGDKAPSAKIRQLLSLPKYDEKDYS